MPPMKIQPLDSQAFQESIRNDSAKPVLKSSLKRLFNRQFPSVLRISSAEKPSFCVFRQRISLLSENRSTSRMEEGPSSSQVPSVWQKWCRISSRRLTRSNHLRNADAIAAIASTGTMTAPMTNLISLVVLVTQYLLLRLPILSIISRV
ncbi:hypothetical protein LOK49_LG06G02874 [Camellia lanceoleosa]|uniref:Uncharacterized protein n=1 Tax=Camellia lanceoleosa TaxID=1840588 RepID=A0ACC0HEV8_9ERIC|nr:hypothetical protein LOK49_LG06G02874 [Camellia lanceoleosa]